jgi:hypothetical protein
MEVIIGYDHWIRLLDKIIGYDYWIRLLETIIGDDHWRMMGANLIPYNLRYSLGLDQEIVHSFKLFGSGGGDGPSNSSIKLIRWEHPQLYCGRVPGRYRDREREKQVQKQVLVQAPVTGQKQVQHMKSNLALLLIVKRGLKFLAVFCRRRGTIARPGMLLAGEGFATMRGSS